MLVDFGDGFPVVIVVEFEIGRIADDAVISCVPFAADIILQGKMESWVAFKYSAGLVANYVIGFKTRDANLRLL